MYAIRSYYDLGEGASDEGLEAVARQALGRVLPGGAAAEVVAHHEKGRSIEAPVVQGMVALGLLAVVLEDVGLEAVEGEHAQVPRGNDASYNFV